MSTSLIGPEIPEQDTTQESKKIQYDRDFMLSLNDDNLPLPAGFKTYKGLMKVDYLEEDIRWRQKSTDFDSTSQEHVFPKQRWQDSRRTDDECKEGLLYKRSDTASIDGHYRSTRYRNRSNAGYENDNHYDGAINYQSHRLFERSTSTTSLINSASMKPPEEITWYYRDPTFTIQGPFSAEDMQKWYKEGYFIPTLMVRREDDVNFQPLIVLIQKVGNMDEPFLTPRPSRLSTSSADDQSTTITDIDTKTTGPNGNSLTFLNVLTNTNLFYKNLQSAYHTHYLKDSRYDKHPEQESSEITSLEDQKPDNISDNNGKIIEDIQWDNGQDNEVSGIIDLKSSSEWTVTLDQVRETFESKGFFDEKPVITERPRIEPSWAAFTSGKIDFESAQNVLSATMAPQRSFREIQREEEEELKNRKPEIPPNERWQAFARSHRI